MNNLGTVFFHLFALLVRFDSGYTCCSGCTNLKSELCLYFIFISLLCGMLKLCDNGTKRICSVDLKGLNGLFCYVFPGNLHCLGLELTYPSSFS